MSSGYSFGLILSNTASSAINNALNRSSKNYDGTYTTNANVLAGISTKNTTTGANVGFDMSVFDSAYSMPSSPYYGSSYSSSQYNYNYTQSPTGINRNALANSNNPFSYGSSVFGSSIIDCYLNSISSVVVGQDAPRSVLEQRLEMAGFGNRLGAGSMYGDYSNYFNVDSVSYNSTQNSSYNVFGTSSNKTAGAFGNIAAAAHADSVFGMMNLLG